MIDVQALEAAALWADELATAGHLSDPVDLLFGDAVTATELSEWAEERGSLHIPTLMGTLMANPDHFTDVLRVGLGMAMAIGVLTGLRAAEEAAD